MAYIPKKTRSIQFMLYPDTPACQEITYLGNLRVQKAPDGAWGSEIDRR